MCGDGKVGCILSPAKIVEMEVQALLLLDWNLSLPEYEFYTELEPLSEPIRNQLFWLQTRRQLPLPDFSGLVENDVTCNG